MAKKFGPCKLVYTVRPKGGGKVVDTVTAKHPNTTVARRAWLDVKNVYKKGGYDVTGYLEDIESGERTTLK